MQKTAQKRSILNKIREMTNVSGIAAEKFFNPEFERVMNSLRSADNKIRAISSGNEVDGEFSGDPISLKDLIKNSKSNLNRREYMTSIAFLSRFHKKMYDIVQVVNNLNTDVDQVHHDFLFKDLDEEQKKYLTEMKTRFAAVYGYNLVAQAGIMDFLHNVSSERGRALAAWEKRYPKQVSKLKKDTANLISKSESILNSLLSTLKDMASARAARKVDDYVKYANKIVGFYSNYDKVFRDHYSENVKGFLDKQELLSPTKKIEDTDLGKQEVSPQSAPIPDLEVHEENDPIPLVSQPPATIPSPPPDSSIEDAYEEAQQPNSNAFKSPKVPTDLSVVPPLPIQDINMDVEDSELEEIIPPRSAHKNFVESLESMANEHPIVIATYIRSYAKTIQSGDTETAVKLFKLAKLIEG